MTRRTRRAQRPDVVTRVDGRVSGDLIADMARLSGTLMGVADGVECGVCRVSMAARLRRIADSLDTLSARINIATTPDHVIAERGEM